MIRLPIWLPLAMGMIIVGAAGPGGAGEPTDPGLESEPVELAATRQAADLSWWSVDSGGGESAGGAFTLTAAVGQSDAGRLSGDGMVLSGGLWSGPEEDGGPIFSDDFESGDLSAWSSAVGANRNE